MSQLIVPLALRAPSSRYGGILVALFISHLVAALSASAQGAAAPKRGISVTLGYGAAGNNKPGQTEKAMRAAGYDDMISGSGCGLFGCAPDRFYPQSVAERQAFSVGVRYRHSTRLSLDVQHIWLGTFRTDGYQGDPSGSGSRTSVKRRGRVTIASIARHWQTAWIGAGPALMTTEWSIPEKRDLSQFGIALDGGLILRRGTYFTPVARGQYWLVGGKALSSQSGVKAPVSGGEFQIGIGFIITP